VGRYDSSKTRVRPIFEALYAQDESGSWVEPLLRMGGRSPLIHLGRLVEPPRFELVAPPPKAFLFWLVKNPTEWPENWKKLKARQEIRDARLLLADGSNLTDALAAIERAGNTSKGYSGWWCLEGSTHVDCALFMENAVVFIEGKRTEYGPSKSIGFAQKRNQIMRNLECVQSYGRMRGLDYYAMLVIEDGDQHRATIAADVANHVADSFPHLSRPEIRDIEKHYLGYTTWKRIVDEFHLPKIASEGKGLT